MRRLVSDPAGRGRTTGRWGRTLGWAVCGWALACGTPTPEGMSSGDQDSVEVVAPAGAARPASRGDFQGQARQELLVVAETDTSTTGLLYGWSRADPGGDGDGWSRVLGPFEVVFGRTGVGPKREGDGRSPEGRFALGDAFGYSSEAPPGIRMGYRHMSPSSVCVDDAGSPPLQHHRGAWPDGSAVRFLGAHASRSGLRRRPV